jgi:Fe-S cluster assembly protein SufD
MKLNQLKGLNATQIAEIIDCDEAHRSHLERFTALPWPDKGSETYRYADLERVWDRDLTHLHSVPATPRASKSLVITDGTVTEAPSGVRVRMIDQSDVDTEHHDPLYYLGHTLSEQIIEVTLEEGTPLSIEHHLHTPNALIAYRIVLVGAPNTHTAVTERFVDMAGEGSLLLYGYDVCVAQDATLTFTRDQTLLADRYTALASHAFDVADNGTLIFGSFDFGSGHGLGQMRVVLGEHAHVTAAHLLYADEEARRGTVSHIVHRGAHSTSRQSAKNILGGRAWGIFDAIIRVEPTAPHTKAHQNNKAILLENGAYMAAKPQLEIYIDELEASHGSTTGQLDPRQMFYLRSRGIKENEARKMLILAFANEIIDSIADANTREQLHASFEQAYYGQTHLECLETCHGCE